MTRFLWWFAHVWMCLVAITVVLGGGCTCTDREPAKKRLVLACEYEQYAPTIAPASQNPEIVAGAMNASFSTNAGNTALSLALATPPGRAGMESSISLQYNSGSNADGIAGVGFSLRAGSSIQRSVITTALDSEVRAVQSDVGDASCLNCHRLVQVSANGKIIEYRTIPDTQVQVISEFENAAASNFEASIPNGSRVHYGSTAASTPMADTCVPQAWLAEKEVDPRGNAIQYDYCFANDDSGYTAEYALTSIRYAPDNVVAFSYALRDEVQTTYSRGMHLQQSLRFAEVQMQTLDGLARRYAFTHETSETTGRVLLQSLQES